MASCFTMRTCFSISGFDALLIQLFQQSDEVMQVKCHLGRDKPEVYHKTSRKNKAFYKWLRNIVS